MSQLESRLGNPHMRLSQLGNPNPHHTSLNQLESPLGSQLGNQHTILIQLESQLGNRYPYSPYPKNLQGIGSK